LKIEHKHDSFKEISIFLFIFQDIPQPNLIYPGILTDPDKINSLGPD